MHHGSIPVTEQGKEERLAHQRSHEADKVALLSAVLQSRPVPSSPLLSLETLPRRHRGDGAGDYRFVDEAAEL